MMRRQPEIEITLDQKPSIMLFYNKTKGGIDTLDRMMRSYFTKRMTGKWPLVLFYNKIDVSAINAFIICQGINHANSNICIRQKRKFLILGKKLCGITKELKLFAPIFETRKRNVTLVANGASLNYRARCTLCHQKKDQICQSFCSKLGKHPEHSDIVYIRGSQPGVQD